MKVDQIVAAKDLQLTVPVKVKMMLEEGANENPTKKTKVRVTKVEVIATIVSK